MLLRCWEDVDVTWVLRDDVIGMGIIGVWYGSGDCVVVSVERGEGIEEVVVEANVVLCIVGLVEDDVEEAESKVEVVVQVVVVGPAASTTLIDTVLISVASFVMV